MGGIFKIDKNFSKFYISGRKLFLKKQKFMYILKMPEVLLQKKLKKSEI
jgi:hypothetical protein